MVINLLKFVTLEFSNNILKDHIFRFLNFVVLFMQCPEVIQTRIYTNLNFEFSIKSAIECPGNFLEYQSQL